jgi:chemotaxis protein methyltransferase CheR
VQETYFWREIDQVRALVDVLVPQYFSTSRSLPLRIWSAACATGEEPLTLAMALNEKSWFDRAPIEIYASDASTDAIEKARRGIYRERSFRNLAPDLRARYFVETDAGWKVNAQIHSRIKWSIANLAADDKVATLPGGIDVIFCRNMFIYFSEESTRKTLQRFCRKMNSAAYLFVGASESLMRLTTDFELQEIGGAFVYVKS